MDGFSLSTRYEASWSKISKEKAKTILFVRLTPLHQCTDALPVSQPDLAQHVHLQWDICIILIQKLDM